jgi:hypothetical protein
MTRHPHETADRRTMALHEAVAARLLRDPSLIAQAHRVLDQWRQTRSVSAPYMEAWSEILSRPVAAIVDTLRDPGETATSLRQVSPFLGILSARERWKILKDEHATRICDEASRS